MKPYLITIHQSTKLNILFFYYIFCLFTFTYILLDHTNRSFHLTHFLSKVHFPPPLLIISYGNIITYNIITKLQTFTEGKSKQ